MTQSILEKIAAREQAARSLAERAHAEIDQLTARLRDLEQELADLATTRKVVLSLDEAVPAAAPALPENPVYQQVLSALATASEAMRARALCQALDLGTETTKIEGMRSRLKRLVALGLVREDEPGLFTLTHP